MALSEKDRKGITIFIVVGVVLAVLLIASRQLKDPKRDDMGCVAGDAPSSTVILLDHSEGVTKQTSREIESRAVKFIEDRVATDGRISLYAVSSRSSHALVPLYEGCKPPSAGNDITNSDKIIKAKFQKQFLEKLQAALRRRYRETNTSPIAQAISDLSASQDLRASSNNLLVFSDMIENSPALNMYSCTPGEDPRETYRRNNAGAVERPSFRNVNVSVHVIPRRDLAPGTLQCRNQFWNWFLGDNPGQEAGVNFDFLPG